MEASEPAAKEKDESRVAPKDESSGIFRLDETKIVM